MTPNNAHRIRYHPLDVSIVESLERDGEAMSSGAGRVTCQKRLFVSAIFQSTHGSHASLPWNVGVNRIVDKPVPLHQWLWVVGTLPICSLQIKRARSNGRV